MSDNKKEVKICSYEELPDEIKMVYDYESYMTTVLIKHDAEIKLLTAYKYSCDERHLKRLLKAFAYRKRIVAQIISLQKEAFRMNKLFSVLPMEDKLRIHKLNEIRQEIGKAAENKSNIDIDIDAMVDYATEKPEQTDKPKSKTPDYIKFIPEPKPQKDSNKEIQEDSNVVYKDDRLNSFEARK